MLNARQELPAFQESCQDCRAAREWDIKPTPVILP
jgi:hypothetical protein